MSADTLVQLRELLANATPGPWCYESCGEKGDGANMIGVAFGPDDDNCERPLSGRLPEWNEDGTEIEYYRDEEVCAVEHRSRNHGANTELIVTAINALPGLLDALDAALRDAERMRAFVEMAGSFYDGSFTGLYFDGDDALRKWRLRIGPNDYWGDSIREAIDSAISSERGGK